MDEDEDDDCFERCKYWDDDGCYCVCCAGCTCEPFHPSKRRIVDTSDDLHQILGAALRACR